MTKPEVEAICDLVERSPILMSALDCVLEVAVEDEVASMRGALSAGSAHQAVLCEGRLQAYTEFLGKVQGIAKKYNDNKKKGDPR